MGDKIRLLICANSFISENLLNLRSIHLFENININYSDTYNIYNVYYLHSFLNTNKVLFLSQKIKKSLSPTFQG